MTVHFRPVQNSRMRGAVLHVVVVKHRNNLTGRFRDRTAMGVRFSAALPTGHGECTMGTRSLSRGGGGAKRPERGVDHPPHLEPKLKKQYSYTSTPPSGPSQPVLGRNLPLLYLTFLYIKGLTKLAKITVLNGTIE